MQIPRPLNNKIHFEKGGKNVNGKVASPNSICIFIHLNPVALRMAKTPLSFGHSECNRVKARTIICCV